MNNITYRFKPKDRVWVIKNSEISEVTVKKVTIYIENDVTNIFYTLEEERGGLYSMLSSFVFSTKAELMANDFTYFNSLNKKHE